MTNQLETIPGTNRDTANKSQWFTPPALAERVVEWAGVRPFLPGPRIMRVLEPSAGNGALVRPLVAAGAEVTAIEIDSRYTCDLDDLLAPVDGQVLCADFLTLPVAQDVRFGLCVMNPPYHDDGERKFITHALRFAPRVVGIFRADVFYTVSRGEDLWKHVRPTRVAFCSRRPWKGAETDYCVLELVKRVEHARNPQLTKVEWWEDSWT